MAHSDLSSTWGGPPALLPAAAAIERRFHAANADGETYHINYMAHTDEAEGVTTIRANFCSDSGTCLLPREWRVAQGAGGAWRVLADDAGRQPDGEERGERSSTGSVSAASAAAPLGKKRVHVQVMSDLLWPWCWVGMARLNRAIAASRSKYQVQVSWLPFFLRPNMPREGKAKGGTPASRVGGWLQRINAKEGPEIEFTGLCDRYPNTELYHVALEHVLDRHGAAVQHKAAQRLFEGYYRDGVFPDEANLVKLALQVEPSLDAAALRAALRDPAKHDSVFDYAQSLAREYRVHGVPYFIVNGVPAFSGAQEPEAFLHAFEAVPELTVTAAA